MLFELEINNFYHLTNYNNVEVENLIPPTNYNKIDKGNCISDIICKF